MPETPSFLAEKLTTEGEKFFAIFAGLTEEQWQTEVYTEGETWTVRNILAHFVTSERGLVKLFESIRTGGLGAAEDFSIDRYNARQQEKVKNLSAAELQEQFIAVRAETVKWVSRLAQEELDIEGRHPYLGQVPLVEMIKMIYLHNQIHFRDFRKSIG